MRNRTWRYIVSILSLTFLVVGPAATPIKASPAKAQAAKKAPETGVKAKKVETPVPRGDWDGLVAAAQKEGSVVVYANGTPKIREDVSGAFKAKYGINIDFLMGRPDELVAKIKTERNAGLYVVDIGILGATPFINQIKPLGIVEPLEPMLILPEVRDPKNWRGGVLPYLDLQKTAFAVTIVAVPPYHRNKDLVKEGEITTSQDLLNPKWKGKIALLDPSTFGSSNNWFTWTVVEVMGKEKGIEFMKNLTAQNPLVTRDDRLLVDSVAKGKYAVGIGPSPSIPASFIKIGAPIDFLDLREPRYTSPGFGVIEVFKNLPHPNATKLFVNWLLSKEGSTIFAVGAQYASTRADVSVQGIGPALIPRPGDINPDVKYKDYQLMKGDMIPVAAEIFSVLRK